VTSYPAPSAGDDRLNLNQATYEELRERNLSVTQTGRVLAYRDRVGGFKSLDELDSIPGFPHSFLADLKANLTL
jgi:DNA uptake protein ComE-like DNA-binding protein